METEQLSQPAALSSQDLGSKDVKMLENRENTEDPPKVVCNLFGNTQGKVISYKDKLMQINGRDLDSPIIIEDEEDLFETNEDSEEELGEERIQVNVDDTARRKDQLALAQIHQGVDYSVFGKIANAKNAKEAWDILKLAYKGVDKAQKSKLQSLRRKYERYEMSGSETVEQYFSRVTDLVNKMRIYGENIPDSKVVEKILRTMPIKYDHVVTTIIESHNLEEMSVAELQGSMKSHVSRILEKTEKPVEEALKTQVTLNNATQTSYRKDNNGGPVYNSGGRGNFRGRGRGNFRGRGRRNNYNPGRGNNDFRQLNQGRGDCRLKGLQNFNTQANIAENQNFGENSETLFLASSNFSVDENVWYLDTSYSNHMCGKKKELFSSLDEFFNSLVKFGNNTNISILGKGQISIRLKDGTQNFISDVFYAPGLHHNLLSMGQLSEKGYDMRVHQGFCTLFDKNGRFVAKVKMTPNRLFPLMIQHSKFSCLNFVIPDENWLWHMHFGYFHFS
ncbi:Retrovirus-related Pol polyprotein from transposon TNT 1-94 [Senna tora]|uniref:Retrovirus-related Pol polyprotein from transposon TNT 1-94 n=1 Tax=Senna tora TaxID=362788 RepID=A0A834XEQ1_9FABA|nr:Retrovirus-related Pol polyprotein from transposon TNT 1-94 [Senna tora]